MESPRLALIVMMARRLVLRSGAPPTKVLRWMWGTLAVTAVGTVAVLSGATHPLWVAVVGAGSMAALIGVALRFFPTAMAVSVTGIALSCASLMTVLGVTTGFESEIVRSVARFNGHVLLTKYGLDFEEYGEVSDRILSDPRIQAASPFAFSMIAVVKVTDPSEGNRGPSVVVGKGIDPRRAEHMDGLADAFVGHDLDALRPGGTLVTPGLVLGDALAREIDVSVGDKVRVVVPAEIDGAEGSFGREPRHAEFELTDLVHTGVSEIDRNMALMHLSAAQSLFFQEGRVTGIEFQLSDPRLATPVAADIESILGYPYRTSTWEQTNAPLLVSLRQVRIAIVVILGLMSVVAASSLVASLLLIVRRKRHDIGVMMAVGSGRALVFWVFESVGVVAGLGGAVLGLLLGALYCVVIGAYRYPLVGDVYPVDHMPVELGFLDAFAPAAVAVALCALASGPVAVQASKVRLLSALGR
ncbi:MAG: ABC transporter permease [Nannocystales bacterium]